MASVGMSEVRAYLGIDGTQHDVYLTGMRREAERRVRRLTLIGDTLNHEGNFAYEFPDDLHVAELILIKWMWDRRENPNDAKSPPPLIGLIDGWERGVGNDNEKPLRVLSPDETPTTPDPFFYIGWILRAPQSGFRLTNEEVLATAISQSEFDSGTRYDSYGPEVIPMVPFTPSGGAYAFFWIAVLNTLGEPPEGTALNGVRQGTGLEPTNANYRDVDTGRALALFVWPVGLNPILGDGTYRISLLGYD